MTLLLFVDMDSIRKRVYGTLLSCSYYTLTEKGLPAVFGPQRLHPLVCDCLPNPESVSPQVSAAEKGLKCQSRCEGARERMCIAVPCKTTK